MLNSQTSHWVSSVHPQTPCFPYSCWFVKTAPIQQWKTFWGQQRHARDEFNWICIKASISCGMQKLWGFFSGQSYHKHKVTPYFESLASRIREKLQGMLTDMSCGVWAAWIPQCKWSDTNSPELFLWLAMLLWTSVCHHPYFKAVKTLKLWMMLSPETSTLAPFPLLEKNYKTPTVSCWKAAF